MTGAGAGCAPTTTTFWKMEGGCVGGGGVRERIGEAI